MTFVSEIENRLHKYGLKVISDREMDYCHQFRLVSGAIINAYFNGKVVVQGKLDPRGKAEQVARLLKALPSHTKFPPSMVAEDATNSLMRGPDDYFADGESRWNAADKGQRIAVDPSHSSQSRALKVVPNLVLDERGGYVPDESPQVNHDMQDPHERW
jgi:hypothetical protein